MLFSAEWQIDLLKTSIKMKKKLIKKTAKAYDRDKLSVTKYIKQFNNREWLLKIQINKWK